VVISLNRISFLANHVCRKSTAAVPSAVVANTATMPQRSCKILYCVVFDDDNPSTESEKIRITLNDGSTSGFTRLVNFCRRFISDIQC